MTPEISQAETLPPDAFVSADWARDERRRVLSPSWQCVPWRPYAEEAADGRTVIDLMARRGSQWPVMVNDAPMVLQRDWKGVLRAFPNVCTHAWHTLVDGYGRQRSLVCPQHGRRFNTEGRVLSHPGFEKNPRFPRPCDHLEQWDADTWQRFVFIRARGGTQPLAGLLAPIQETTAFMPWDRARRVSAGAETRRVPGNWKLHAWNYLDRFHIGFLHSSPHGLSDAIDLNAYQTEIYPDSVLQWAWARRPEDGFEPEWLPARWRGERRVFALWWFVFPNLTLNFYPWGLSVNLYQATTQADTTLFAWYHLVWDEARYAELEERWLNSQVDAEDVEAMRQVQRGLASGLARPGLFAPDHEAASCWFHQKIAAMMGGC